MSEKLPRTPGANTPRGWISKELVWLRDHASDGAVEIAAELGRTVKSVQAAAYRHRISLRRPGMRGGSVLGQPRGISLRAELRAGALAGRVPAEALEARHRLSEPELCPACGTRAATHQSGFCRPCHLHRLARAHREEIERLEAEDDARRDLWQSRQALKRARDRVAAGSGGPTDGVD